MLCCCSPSRTFSTLFKLSTSRAPTKIFVSILSFVFCTFFFALLYCFFTFSLALFLTLSLPIFLCLCLVSFFRPHTRKSANRLIPTGGQGRRSSGQDKVAHAPDADVDRGVDAASQLTHTQTQTQTSASSSLDWQTTKRARRSRIFVAPLRSQYANVTVCHGVSMRWAPPAESSLLSPSLSTSLFHSLVGSWPWFLALALDLVWRLFNVCLLCLKRQYTVRI